MQRRPAEEQRPSVKPVWDFEGEDAPTARSLAASGALPGGKGLGASPFAAASRPRFDIDFSARASARGGAEPGPASVAAASRLRESSLAPDGARSAAASRRPSPPSARGGEDPPATDEEAQRLERQQEAAWYDEEEGGGHGESYEPFAGDDGSYAKREVELQKRLTRRDGSAMTLAQSKRANQMHLDHNAWEENRLMTSGVARLREVDLDFEGEEEARTQLLVHDARPPFLDGRAVFSKQSEAVLPVKDPTSDLALIARKGSALVKEFRRKRDENKSRERFWELGGTHMGNILGLQKAAAADDGDAEAEAGAVGADGQVDFKAGSKFAAHMGAKSVAASDFSRNKTLAEQRRFLPVFSVRDELMQVIRENNVVVVVGETGSGKTTQMTQFMVEEGYA